MIVIVVAFDCNGARTSLRAPAYPLLSLDPSVNLWSMGDTLYADATRHWTRRQQPLLGVLTVDDVSYRFLGQEFNVAESVAPNSEWGDWVASYTTTPPSPGWANTDFDDSSWETGAAAFATEGEEGKFVMVKNEFCKTGARTKWTTPYLWVRRTADLPDHITGKEMFLEVTYDDAADVYINGVRVFSGTSPEDHRLIPLTGEAAEALHPGKNVIAAKAINNEGYGVIDFALIAQEPVNKQFENTAMQTGIDFLPTQTRYSFVCGPVDLDVTFTAPFLPDDLELAGRPVNYISYDVKSRDGKSIRSHSCSLHRLSSPVIMLGSPQRRPLLNMTALPL